MKRTAEKEEDAKRTLAKAADLEWLRMWASGHVSGSPASTAVADAPPVADETLGNLNRMARPETVAKAPRKGSGEHKRCRGTINFSPGANAASVDHVLVRP